MRLLSRRFPIVAASRLKENVLSMSAIQDYILVNTPDGVGASRLGDISCQERGHNQSMAGFRLRTA
jgi:hypothetical protein